MAFSIKRKPFLCVFSSGLILKRRRRKPSPSKNLPLQGADPNQNNLQWMQIFRNQISVFHVFATASCSSEHHIKTIINIVPNDLFK